ncbi:helix-turn-helix domain-containing protein [Liquorilactobacillus oeni]|uniref:Transcriptional regulator n=1 Tax=Liquorilactobacillus oeni DSM 19972 TaxID=1423777 RepID=A0A0R1M9K4_9LACO|nr:RodZ domain-containing protein [Liquorilactobacillus oeni]KRL04780.1 transcriptional regulator [Liquorilactobacillus oeni DSM 19972]
MSEIGKTLKAARIEKGYTLDDLQQITKIQKRYLIAIEDEHFGALPGEFYVKAFIKQYAETVGLDPEQFLSTLGQGEKEKKEVNEKTAVVNKRSRTESTRESMEKTNTFNRFLNYLPSIIIIAVVVVILGSIYFVSWSNHRKTAQTQQIEKSSAKVAVSSQKTSSKKESAKSNSESKSKTDSSAKKSSTKKKKKSVKIQLASNSGSSFTYNLTGADKIKTVVLNISGSSAWSAVSVDGSQQWQGTLSDGQQHEVSLPDTATSVTINLGNSNATSLKINGKTFNFKKDNDSLTVRTLTINAKQ